MPPGYKRSPEKGFRKLAMAFWDRPKDGTIYGSMRFNMLKTLHFQNAIKEKYGVKPSIGQILGRAIAIALTKVPEANSKIIWGSSYIKDSVDIYFQVDIEGGKDLSGVVVSDAGNKSIVDICNELRDAASKLRSGKDVQYEKTQKGVLAKAPSWILRPLVWLLTFMEYNLGFTATFAGAKQEPFGTAMVTNVSRFGVDVAYAPLVPVSRVPSIYLIGGLVDRAWISNNKVCIRPTVNASATIDHRVIDGNKIGRITRIVTGYMEDPYSVETDLGLENPWEGIDPPDDHPWNIYPKPEDL